MEILDFQVNIYNFENYKNFPKKKKCLVNEIFYEFNRNLTESENRQSISLRPSGANQMSLEKSTRNRCGKINFKSVSKNRPKKVDLEKSITKSRLENRSRKVDYNLGSKKNRSRERPLDKRVSAKSE